MNEENENLINIFSFNYLSILTYVWKLSIFYKFYFFCRSCNLKFYLVYFSIFLSTRKQYIYT